MREFCSLEKKTANLRLTEIHYIVDNTAAAL